MTKVIDAVYAKRKLDEEQANAMSSSWRDPLTITKQVAEKYYKCISTPVALSCLILLRHEEYDQLVSKAVHPIDYNSAQSFENDYAAVKFLSKCAGLPTSFNTRLAALSTEAWCEAKCKRTNYQLRYLSLHRSFSPYMPIYDKAKKIIAKILGAPPDFEELISLFRFGPGASSATTGFDTTIVAKISNPLECTLETQMDLQYAVQLLPMLDYRYDVHSFVGPLCGPSDAQILDSTNWEAVPKSAKTDRGIVIPMNGLMLGQKAIGSFMRSRMKTNGIDLNYLWKENQMFAEISSSDDYYSTIDLMSASSTIAYELPYFLLPRSWALLLDRWRDGTTNYDGTIHTNNKFSAMGNGYTFELESLIFYAIAKAVSITKGYRNSFVSSFGDDIILPTDCVDLLREVLIELGFTVNESKSFSSTPFRESCGGDYWNSTNVTPVYLKGLIKDEVTCIKLLNRIRHKSNRYGSDSFCSVQFKPVWLKLMDLLQEFPISIGGCSYGDSVIWARPEERGKFNKPTFYAGAWYTTTYGFRNRPRKVKSLDRLLSAVTLQSIWDDQKLIGKTNLHPDIDSDVIKNLRYSSGLTGFYGEGARQIIDIICRATSTPRTCRGKSPRRVLQVSMSDVLAYPPIWL